MQDYLTQRMAALGLLTSVSLPDMGGPAVHGRYSACKHFDIDQLGLLAPLLLLGVAQVELEVA